MIRRGLGKGMGMGYKNLVPMDSHIHSLSAKGVKTYLVKYYDRYDVVGKPNYIRFKEDEDVKNFIGMTDEEWKDYKDDGYFKDATTEYEWKLNAKGRKKDPVLVRLEEEEARHFRNVLRTQEKMHKAGLDAKGMKFTDLELTRKAYGDAVKGGNGFERDLDWTGTSFMSADMLRPLMKQVGQYNEFNSERVYNLIKKYPELKFKLGREGSPVVYAKGSYDALLRLKSDVSGYADEVDFVEMKTDKPYLPESKGRKDTKWVDSKNLRMWWD